MRRFAEERRWESLGDALGESPPLRSEMSEVRRPSAGEDERKSMLRELDERRKGLGEGRWTAGGATGRDDGEDVLCTAGAGEEGSGMLWASLMLRDSRLRIG
jgi:hypothetical protein